MTDRGMNKVVLVKRRTRYEELKRRYNTIEQAKFYIEHLGADFSDYELEDRNYNNALESVRNLVRPMARLQEIDREYISNMIFGPKDIVIAVGQDGLVANTMKYLDGQPLIGINPDPARWDGVLLPFETGDLERVLPKVIDDTFSEKNVTMGKVESKDGQVLYAVNDFFIGVDNHTSARYHINYRNRIENQSSSGIIISTGFGMTGWHKSVMAQFRGMARSFGLGDVKEPVFDWGAKSLTFQVREPYPSRFTQAELVYGQIEENENLLITSNMSENGVVFSDGILDDTIEFNAGMQIEISVADRIGRLVTG
ncbi:MULTISPECIES: sugar kinase [unclassified Butyrivibrio]|jgi:NAD kinase|uniref:sugar kinase n=1 Tax=unclassified Butyrivibrio TaxID=2639466 RepID=UPI0003B2E8BD|nr:MULTISPECIES: sugar kinase [unclassified Butyrivibrio]MDC7293910.1 sugar kinase [Butyrivibrio sp. DSM 10294]